MDLPRGQLQDAAGGQQRAEAGEEHGLQAGHRRGAANHRTTLIPHYYIYHT